MALTTLNTAVAAPMPTASVSGGARPLAQPARRDAEVLAEAAQPSERQYVAG
jgi:hypothetical protein